MTDEVIETQVEVEAVAVVTDPALEVAAAAVEEVVEDAPKAKAAKSVKAADKGMTADDRINALIAVLKANGMSVPEELEK